MDPSQGPASRARSSFWRMTVEPEPMSGVGPDCHVASGPKSKYASQSLPRWPGSCSTNHRPVTSVPSQKWTTLGRLVPPHPRCGGHRPFACRLPRAISGLRWFPACLLADDPVDEPLLDATGVPKRKPERSLWRQIVHAWVLVFDHGNSGQVTARRVFHQDEDVVQVEH